MLTRFYTVLAALVFVTACEVPPTPEGRVSGADQSYTRDMDPGTRAYAGRGDRYDLDQQLVENVPDRVFFDTDSSVLDAEARDILGLQARWLKENPDLTVTIEGHCDERATREYNLALGDRRANAVKNYLSSLGIEARRVSTISYGKERPVAVGSNAQAWAQNRRGVTVVD